MLHWDEIAVFVVVAAAVTGIGLVAGRWRAADLGELAEWGLAGRRFGTVVTWFLLGGDLYTAYTFVAVPGLVFGAGALGFFALPYSTLTYPLVLIFLPRLWQVARNRGYVTASDFVRDRFDSRLLALLIAISGICATMPYIALQIFGIEVVIAQMGLPVEVALAIAFVVLVGFTYVSGLRAPALIAVVKDILVWIFVIACLIYVPLRLGGYGAVFGRVPAAKLTLPPAQVAGYSTLVLGSALALFLYPHAITGCLSSAGRRVLERNTSLLPAYSVLLGLVAVLGYMAIAIGIHPSKAFGANAAVPELVAAVFPGWFAGLAFAAIAIGALVPASVMSIAAANLFNRNIWREFVRPGMSSSEEANVSKIVSLLVKVGAVAYILFGNTQYAIFLQTAGGAWMMQTLPAVFLALYFRRLNRWAVIAGWLAGTGWATYLLVTAKFASLYPFVIGGHTVLLYSGLVALGLNLLVVVAGSLLAAAMGAREPEKLTAADYRAVRLG
jgi:SSS family solute:Na+ symporter